MTKLAPPGRAGVMLGIWFLSASWGSKLAGILGEGFSPADPSALTWFFLNLAGLGLVSMLLLLALVPWLKRLMEGVD